MYSLQYRAQTDHNKYEEKGGGRLGRPPYFWILGVVWPIYGLCMTYIWLRPQSENEEIK